jgi:hypothetical protein
MRKLLFFIPLILFAQNQILMPPMPPNMNIEKKHVNKSQQKKPENNLPKECKIIPPMLIFMPPPLESDLIKCKNKLFLPKLEVAKKVFSKKNMKVKSVSIVEGFVELYKVSTDKGDFYCNKTLNKCFKVAK